MHALNEERRAELRKPARAQQGRAPPGGRRSPGGPIARRVRVRAPKQSR